MPAWVGDSIPALERWAADHDVSHADLDRVRTGLETSAGREPSEETAPQRPEVLIPDLEANAWWDAARFPWVADLEAAYPDVRAEFEAVGGLAGEEAVSHPNSGNLADSGRWTAYYFHLLGKRFDDHVAACPRTVKALAGADGVTESGMCYYSIMGAGTHVAAHTGFINARIRCHLGLVVPEGGRMRVGSETRGWTEGKAFLFDDSFEHEVWNEADSGRAVLLFDVWHPDLTRVERRALAHMMTVWKTYLYKDD